MRAARPARAPGAPRETASVATPRETPAAPVVRETSPEAVTAVAAVAERPSSAPASAVFEAPADKDLFGNEVVRPRSDEPELVDETTLPLPPIHAPLHPIGDAREAILGASLSVLEQVAAEARACAKCGLCETRTKAVPGVGSARTGIVFVGEAPGADEDAQGEPFVGRAGQLLTQMIKGMNDRGLVPGVPLNRESVYICNVLKCRPPENRNPLPHEVEQCSPYLMRQLEALRPRVICCLGKFAAELLVGAKGTIASLRGKTYRWGGAKLIVTYHPAALLRNPGWKQPAWEDLQRLAREYLADGPLNA